MQEIWDQILKGTERPPFPLLVTLSTCSGPAGPRPGRGAAPGGRSSALPRAAACVLPATAPSPLSGPSRARTWISGSRAVPSEAQPRARRGLQGRVRLRALVRTRSIWAQAGEVPLGFPTTSSPTESVLLGHEAFANCSTYGPIGPDRSAHFWETRRPRGWGKPSSAVWFGARVSTFVKHECFKSL